MTTRSNRQTGMKRPFTLIELLLVISIMIIVLGFTVPAFRRMATGSAVKSTARMISGQLNLARAAAIAEQKYIAMVLPGRYFQSPDEGDDAQGEYHFSAFRIAEVQKPETGVADNKLQLKCWYPGSAWKFLPAGAVVAETNDTAKEQTKSSGVELYGTVSGVNEINVDSWLSNDKLNGDATSNSSWIVDGDVNLVKGKNNNSNTANARCIVFNPRGRCCTVNGAGEFVEADRYITIVEGRIEESGTNEYTLADHNLYNMTIIKVSGLSGRCSYLSTSTD